MKRTILLVLLIFLTSWASAQAQVFGAVGNAIIGTPVACTPQTITLTDPSDMTVGDADQTITCSSTSGGACSLSTNNSAYCTIAAGKLHAVGASGTNGCILYADQAGGSGYCAAPQVNQTVTISAGGGTVVYDNATGNPSSFTNYTTSMVFSHTVGSSTGRALVVCAGEKSLGDVSGITYNSVAMNPVSERSAPGSNNGAQVMYTLLNPDSGAHDVVVSYANTQIASYPGAAAISYSGVSVIGIPGGAHGQSGTATATVPSGSGQVVVDCMKAYNQATGGWTPDASQTLRVGYVDNYGVPIASDKSGASSVTMTWTGTSSWWSIFTLPLASAGAVFHTTLNPSDAGSGLTLSNGNLTATYGSSSGVAVRSNASHVTGKYYLEYTPSAGSAGGNNGLGVSNGLQSLATWLGNTGSNSVGYASVGDGGVYIDRSVVTTLASWGDGDVVQMAVDLTAHLIWFKVNAGNWNDTTADPAAGTGGIDISSMYGSSIYAAINFGTSSSAGTVNFGASAYTYTPPSGFGNW